MVFIVWLLLLIVDFAVTLYWAVVFQLQWEWFITTSFQMEPLTYLQCLGICLTSSLFLTKVKTANEREKDMDKEPEEDLADGIRFVFSRFGVITVTLIISFLFSFLF